MIIYLLSLDADPSLDLLLDSDRVQLYVEWLRRYYDRGSTVRNKCQHLAGLLGHLEGVKSIGDDSTLRAKITLCCSIFNEHAQTAKVKALRQRAALENEDQHLVKGKIMIEAISFLFNDSLGKVLTEEESKSALRWMCARWKRLLPAFINKDKGTNSCF